jgi:5-enolpyruvylshikimate-3-phosphate synthase
MAWAVASLVATGSTTIQGTDAVDVSYPGFWRDLQLIAR